MTENLAWSLNDPYVYHSLLNLKQSRVEALTTKGSVRGLLLDVQPDHIVIEMGGTPFHIRIAQVVWYFPVKDR
ncbi:YuzF family protein [Alkalihalobacillus trypoxylicola]|uniref:DUF2642 domain-containing protein n=1 Tax=Alkalihalobacillus trypoxylicola TaxID=519424 RepID=A0A161QNR6_9BACI|nr:YuzF family protein [Alkalihalobacillus trypoxylicola]KYG32043.1 hypothetical protein AZF04_04515 [Alkalihalobacillus trypoxylicola]GAF65947.1 hypothetical protein BTS2_2847 [Bacillus sp. TS-2]